MRRGWPLQIGDAPPLLPVETSGGTIQAAKLLVSGARAATLKLANQREAAEPDHPVLLHGAEPFDLTAALAIADPALDLSVPLKGPFKAEPIVWEAEATAALVLARHAGILPAFLVGPEPAGEPVALDTDDVALLDDASALTLASRARLPVESCEEAEIVAFRETAGTSEHIALVLGTSDGTRDPLVRIHSECLTGDILGSLRCDCGPQLDAALGAMSAEAASGGWGVLLYLRQEGRGIGLINKLRAYRLQDQGFDTLEANRRLGLPEEARDFALAARMLALLGIGSVRLMTNNPAKVAALEAAGVTVAERVPHSLPANPHNARYLATKRDRAGHLL